MDEDLQSHVKNLVDEDPLLQVKAMKFFQSLLSVSAPDIDRVLSLNILSRVTELMTKRSDDVFLLQASWFLTNVATTSTTIGSDSIIKANGIHALVSVFDKGNIDVKVQALWALSNIFQDTADCRNKVMEMGLLPRIAALLAHIPCDNYDGIQIALWAIVNLVDQKFYPPLGSSALRKCLDVFLDYLNSANDSVKLESLKGISSISENKDFNFDVVGDRIMPDLINILKGAKRSMRKEALRIIGNIAYTSASNLLIEFNVVATLRKLLWEPDDNIVKETCWILSNVCADGYVNQLFDADIFHRVVELLTHKDRKIRRESIWVVANTCKNGTYEQVKELVIMEVFRQLTFLLDEKEDSEILTTVCEAIYTILKKGHNHFSDVNLFAILVDRYGALKKIEYLQFHSSGEVESLAIKILATFYRKTKPVITTSL